MNPLRILARSDRRLVPLLLLALLLTGCIQDGSKIENSTGIGLTPISNWQSGLYLDHPLLGSIWHSGSNRFLTPAELADMLDEKQVVLLGEKHDNPDHHQLQQNFLEYLLQRNKLASTSFEMLGSDADERLAQLSEENFDSPEQLREFLQWDQAGWDWAFYGPMITRVVEANVPVRSANLSQAQVGEVYGMPLDGSIAEVLDEAAIEQLNVEIDASHCNLLPTSQFPAMVRVQQARDHEMANSLASGLDANGMSVLVAGNYHVRRDLGVPNYLFALRPELDPTDVLSLALMEVHPDSVEPLDYLQAYSDVMPFDVIWFTPAISDEDYCANLSADLR